MHKSFTLKASQYPSRTSRNPARSGSGPILKATHSLFKNLQAQCEQMATFTNQITRSADLVSQDTRLQGLRVHFGHGIPGLGPFPTWTRGELSPELVHRLAYSVDFEGALSFDGIDVACGRGLDARARSAESPHASGVQVKENMDEAKQNTRQVIMDYYLEESKSLRYYLKWSQSGTGCLLNLILNVSMKAVRYKKAHLVETARITIEEHLHALFDDLAVLIVQGVLASFNGAA
ncbi:hypothetical protein B0H11DRAFT_1913350 [Mycena galericulata]|nr:hypothetical protein B0H11DRAFT_1913350 [Mycena galericulata]